MKKIILPIVLALTLLAALVPQPAHATTNATPVIIKGQLLKHGQAIANKQVTFEDGGHAIGTTTTNANGAYRFVTNSDAAPENSIVTAKADENNDGKIDGIAAARVTGPVIIIIIIIGVIDVPEYGVVGGIATAALGLGVIAWRRRQIGASLL